MSRNYKASRKDEENQVVKTKGKRTNNKFKKGNRSTRSEVLEKGSRDNDPNWYFVSSDLAEQCSQLSFQNILGYSDAMESRVPSIMRINDVMCPGNTYNVDEARLGGSYFLADGGSQVVVSPANGKAGVNLMAAKLYTTLSSFTGRTASYAPQDVAIMIMGIASIAEISESLRRAFGIALTYNFRNRSVPLGLLESMGIDVADFIANLSIYRMRFNVAISRINQVPLLENIAYIKKSRDIYQKVYTDKPVNMAQIFYHMPMYAFVLDETSDPDGSILRAVEFSPLTNGSRGKTMGVLLSILEDMITAALESSTLNFIYADLLNMANKLNVQTWQFDYLAENYVVMPEYNSNAILQMHNLTITGVPQYPLDNVGNTIYRKKFTVTPGNFDLVVTGPSIVCDPNTNEIIYNPMFADNGVANPHRYTPLKWIIDMPSDNPSVEDRIEALRYTSLASGNMVKDSVWTGGATWTILWALPDHYVAYIDLYGKYSTVGSNSGKVAELDCSVMQAPTTAWHMCTQIAGAPGLYVPTNKVWLGDLDYWTEIDLAYVARLNQAMTIGLFDFRVK